MNLKITDYPIDLVENFQKIIFEIRKLIVKNNNLIQEVENPSKLFEVIPITLESNFSYKIVSIGLDITNKKTVTISRIPKSSIQNTEYKPTIPLDQLLDSFNAGLI